MSSAVIYGSFDLLTSVGTFLITAHDGAVFKFCHKVEDGGFTIDGLEEGELFSMELRG